MAVEILTLRVWVNLLRAVLRPLSLVLIAVTVLLAVVTATGRVLVAWLPQFEPRLNTYLAQSGVGDHRPYRALALC